MNKEKKKTDEEGKVSVETRRQWKMHLGSHTWGFKSLPFFPETLGGMNI